MACHSAINQYQCHEVFMISLQLSQLHIITLQIQGMHPVNNTSLTTILQSNHLQLFLTIHSPSSGTSVIVYTQPPGAMMWAYSVSREG